MGKTNNFPGLKNETETETFNFGLMEPRPRPRLSFLVSWNQERDFHFWSRRIDTETFILGLIEQYQDRHFYFESCEIHTETETII